MKNKIKSTIKAVFIKLLALVTLVHLCLHFPSVEVLSQETSDYFPASQSESKMKM